MVMTCPLKPVEFLYEKINLLLNSRPLSDKGI
jgi:hypothetical protein